MQDMDFGIPGVEKSVGGVHNGMYIRFYRKLVELPARSAEEGRPIFEERDYIEIPIPGSRDTFDGLVADKHKKEYPIEWAAYQASEGGAKIATGTPLSEWQSLSRSRAAELIGLRIYTVEQLAEASDSVLQLLGMDGRKLKEQAVAFLDGIRDASAASRYAAERLEVSRQLELANERNAELEARLAKLEEALNKKGSKKGE